jgi:CRP-like cAMP-binding protein
MVELDVPTILNQAYFLRDVPPGDLRSASAALVRLERDAGEDILRQGAAPDALYFIAAGTVELYRRDPQGRVWPLARLVEGDSFGEAEVVFRQPRLAAARAVSPVVVYRWERSALAAFMDAHPAALASLRFGAQSALRALRHRLRWLEEGETVYGFAGKHPVLLARALIVPALLLATALLLLTWNSPGIGSILTWLGAGMGMAALAFGAWQWIDWGNDHYIVTDRRAVWLEKVIGLYDSRQEAPLRMILSVSVSTGLLGRLLKYGDIVIRTFTGKVTFRAVSHPAAMAAMVEEHWRRLQAQTQRADRESILEALQSRLEGEEETPPAPPPAPPLAPVVPPRDVGLDRWGFQVRFEEKGVITYRKHWAVLLKATSTPSILIVALAAFIGAQLAGWLPGLGSTPMVMLTTGVFVPLAGWWLYQYADWVNDIYQLAADQILDIHKKPLGRELRKVAPLENVLGTEVERKGIAGLVLNYGNVVANVGTAQFVFEGVYDPAAVQQDIVRYQDAYFARKQDSERTKRQDEMVEWLNAYHREIAQPNTGEGRRRSGRRQDDHPRDHHPR